MPMDSGILGFKSRQGCNVSCLDVSCHPDKILIYLKDLVIESRNIPYTSNDFN
jgi:hypothetical protein